MRYAKRGQGAEQIFLVHGFGGDLDNWLFNIDALAENATVYALDLPGHGQSTKALSDASLKGLSHALVDFLNSLASQRASRRPFDGRRRCAAGGDRPSGAGEIVDAHQFGWIGTGDQCRLHQGFCTCLITARIEARARTTVCGSDLVSRQLIDDVLKYKRLDGVGEALDALAKSLFADGKQASVLAADAAKTARPVAVIWGAKTKSYPPLTPGRCRRAGARKSSPALATWFRWKRPARSTNSCSLTSSAE